MNVNRPMAGADSWINKDLYPFESRFATVDNNRLHYIDEGGGPTLLFVHGTPEWSFGFRDVIKPLRSKFRCVAIDLLGFGLSDKPVNADYTCAGHVRRLTLFIEQLGLRNINVVANDFGGSIALNYVLDHSGNVNKIVLFNTWMRSLKDDKHYSTPAKIAKTWFGKFMYLTMNAPVNTIMPAAYGDRKKLSAEVHRHYREALPKGNRTATYAFALELSNANEWWQSLWERLGAIDPGKFLFFWGMKDKFIPASELALWKQKLPSSRYIIFEDAGHFVQEEKAEEMSRSIEEFIHAG